MTAKEPDAAPVEADPELLRPVLPEVADPVVVAEGPDTVPVDPAGGTSNESAVSCSRLTHCPYLQSQCQCPARK